MPVELDKAVADFQAEATSGSYEHLLATAMAYLDAEPTDYDAPAGAGDAVEAYRG